MDDLDIWFESCVDRFKDNTAIITADRQQLSLGRLNKARLQIADLLAAQGVGAGSRVFCDIPRFGINIAFWLAVWRLGADLLAQNSAKPFLAKDVEPTHGLLVEPDAADTPYRQIVFDPAILKKDTQISRHETTGRVFVPTAATTRVPKLLAFEQKQILDDARRYTDLLGPPKGAVFTTTSLNSPRVFRDMIRAFDHGTPIIGPDMARDNYWPTIVENQVTEIFVTPLHLHWLVHSTKRPSDLTQINRVFIGSGTPQTSLLEKAYNLFGDVIELAAGIPETSFYAFKKYDPKTHEFGQIGTVQNNLSAGIFDRVGKGLPNEEVGRLRLFVPKEQRFAGYVNEEPAYDDGWVDTGFLASMDSEGEITKLGRIDDRLSLGGTRYFAGQIEDVLVQLPTIADICALKVLDSEGAEALGLMILPNPGFAPEAVSKMAKRNLSGIGQVLVQTVEALPMLPTGTVDRKRAAHLWRKD